MNVDTRLNPTLAGQVLDYLGLRRALPTLGFLDLLIQRYTASVPWESAFRIAKRSRTALLEDCPRWPEEFWQDALARGGGGTCFESNYAFISLLRALGFAGYLTINDMEETTGCHTAIILTLQGKLWLVDAGYPLYTTMPLESSTSRRHCRFHTYTLTPNGDNRYQVKRDKHPQLYAFTLVNQPVDEVTYRSATTANYDTQGFFLDRVIITKVIDHQVWRFNSGERPFHLEAFENGARTDYPLQDNPAVEVAEHFGMNLDIVRMALRATDAI